MGRYIITFSLVHVCPVSVGPDPHPCPVDIEVIALVGRGGAVAYWEEPASRNKVLSYPPFPGSFFEVGMHPICYHFTTVTNETDSCTFNVIVKEGKTLLLLLQRPVKVRVHFHHHHIFRVFHTHL